MNIESKRCKRCDAEIPAARLQALPETWLCIECSREVGGEFVITAIPENIGKAGSIKKNYGAWTVRKTRRPIYRKDEG